MDNQINIIDELINNIKKNEIFKKFQYSKEFFEFWRKQLVCSFDNNTIYFLNTDEAHLYQYKREFYDITIDFEFNISYLMDMLNLDIKNGNKIFPVVSLSNKNGNLFYYTDSCFYTKYNKNEVDFHYTEMEKILISPLPVLNNELIVLDGNHRVCKQIYNNCSTIKAYYVFDEIAARSLSTPFQVSVYCFLFDVARISHNYGKINDRLIRKNLNIYNPNSAVYSTVNRKRIDEFR